MKAWFLGVCVALPPIVGGVLVFCVPRLDERLDHLGSALGGYAAILAALFAVVKGSEELATWRRQRREERAAQVAGDAIVAALNFADLMASIAAHVHLFHDDEHLRERLAGMGEHDVFQTFMNALRHAEAFLPEETVAPLHSLRSLYWELPKKHASLVRLYPWTSILPDDNDAVKQEMLDREWFKSAPDRIRAATEDVTSALRKHTIGDVHK